MTRSLFFLLLLTTVFAGCLSSEESCCTNELQFPETLDFAVLPEGSFAEWENNARIDSSVLQFPSENAGNTEQEDLEKKYSLLESDFWWIASGEPEGATQQILFAGISPDSIEKGLDPAFVTEFALPALFDVLGKASPTDSLNGWTTLQQLFAFYQVKYGRFADRELAPAAFFEAIKSFFHGAHRWIKEAIAGETDLEVRDWISSVPTPEAKWEKNAVNQLEAAIPLAMYVELLSASGASIGFEQVHCLAVDVDNDSISRTTYPESQHFKNALGDLLSAEELIWPYYTPAQPQNGYSIEEINGKLCIAWPVMRINGGPASLPAVVKHTMGLDKSSDYFFARFFYGLAWQVLSKD